MRDILKKASCMHLKIDANYKIQHYSMNINVADLVMEDSMSVKSMESVATSDEYEFVNEKGTSKQQQALLEPPMLKIANNGNLEDLQNNLREVCTFIDLIKLSLILTDKP